jgi:hypothetical protein
VRAKLTIGYEVFLEKDEAKWLKAITQNPLRPDETPLDAHMREEIFMTLSDAEREEG